MSSDKHMEKEKKLYKQYWSTLSSSQADLFYRLVELYQATNCLRADYASKTELRFLWATYNVQEESNTTKCFDKEALKLYSEKYSFSRHQVNKYTNTLNKKMLLQRSNARVKLLPMLERFNRDGFDLRINIEVEDGKSI